MAWRAAKSLLTLHAQLKPLTSGAPASSWGLIGDTSHTSTSDHAPKDFPGWGNDIVTAADFPNGYGLNARAVLEQIRLSRDSRVKYAISNGQMFSSYVSSLGVPAWTWRKYTGSDPHFTHGHLSVVGDKRADDPRPWRVVAPMTNTATPITLTPGGKKMFVLAREVKGKGQVWLCDGIRRRPVTDELIGSLRYLAANGAISPLFKGGEIWEPAELDAFGVADAEVKLDDVQVEKVAAAIVARTDNPLGDADKPALIAAVKQALREGVEG